MMLEEKTRNELHAIRTMLDKGIKREFKVTVQLKMMKRTQPYQILGVSRVVHDSEIYKYGRYDIETIEKFIDGKAIEISGPQVWTFHRRPDKRMETFIGYPVKTELQIEGSKISLKKVPAWNCLSTMYRGTIESIPDAWAELERNANGRGVEITDTSREVYHKFSGRFEVDNFVELQFLVSYLID